jgi:glycosyltransferase involved in cell wall biosynthesis
VTPPLRILLASPAYWPAHAFGGPVVVARELVSRLVASGHAVEVLTTTLRDVREPPGRRTRVEVVDGARVTYLGTPLRYRWMGVTPTLPLALRRLERPDVGHLIGFRDPVSTAVAAWCRRRRIPYVFEPVGMFRPRLRKVRLKRAFDATLARGVASGARLVVVSSPRERDDVVAGGVDPERVRLRGNAFPEPPPPGGDPLAGVVPPGAPVVLYVGRLAAEKGVEHLLEAVRALPHRDCQPPAESERP